MRELVWTSDSFAAGEPPARHAIVDDEPIVRRVHDDFAGGAREGEDLGCRAAPKLKLLAQGTVPKIDDVDTASLVEPKSSDTRDGAGRQAEIDRRAAQSS